MKDRIRILQISGDIRHDSGIMNVILNWHRYIDTTKIQFDYLTFFPSNKSDYEQEILKLGGRVYQLPHPYKHPLNFLKESYEFFKTHHYRTIHSHITHLNLFFYPLAKLFDTKNIIQHAHGTKWSDKKLNAWRNYLMLHAVWPLITCKLACSQAAGNFWYKKGFTVINNGVNVEKFSYSPKVRSEKRRELGLEDNFVIGHVGRFSPEKNHTFLIDMFEQLIKKDPSAKLVLVGGGPLENKIRSLVVSKQLQCNVLFLGTRKDVPELLQAFDVFVLPSFHEGMPVVAIEAQAAGLPCVFAGNITPEVCLLSTSCILSLQDCIEKWAEKILSLKNISRMNGVTVMKEMGFDSSQTAKQIQGFYLKLKQ